MKSHTVHLTMNVPARMDFVNITKDVEKAVADSGVREGLCLVNAMHITASVFINDDEPGLHHDYKKWLEQLAPFLVVEAGIEDWQLDAVVAEVFEKLEDREHRVVHLAGPEQQVHAVFHKIAFA